MEQIYEKLAILDTAKTISKKDSLKKIMNAYVTLISQK